MRGSSAGQPEKREPLGGPVVRAALVLAAGAFVALLDTTVVGVALESFARRFGAGPAQVQWVATAYLLAMSAVIPATGWAARRFGAVACWTASAAVFLLGSVLCGLAWSLGSLVAFRVVQGLGAGMLFPLMRILVVEVAGPARMGRTMALIAVPVLLAPVAGPVVGGALIQGHSWRWVFLLNVPVCLAVAVLSPLLMRNRRDAAPGRLDLAGLVTVSGGLTAAVLGFVRLGGGAPAGGPRVLVPLLAAAVLLTAHGVLARRRAGDRVVDFALFRDRAFTASASVSLLNSFGLYGAVVLVPLFFQQAGGRGPLTAGLVMVAQGAGAAVAVLLVGRVIDARSNPRALVLAGLALVAAGLAVFARAGSAEPGVALLVALFAQGVGLALAASPVMVTLYHSLPPAAVPAATTANAVAQQLGAAAGTTVVALVLAHASHGGAGTVAAFRAVFAVALGFVLLTALPAAFLPTGRKG
ncbi:DHA2 family efflux MFS transporter permease subunit [Kitasatospora sp. CB01950]|uniref:DHA2 family efflux MFS transporter permease subunit n=1 Tax=Kitasatospora sp. CB01950 TaxID=1703930 RepID=UPI0009680C5B|nr:DHA2 family efflux MFS transporter permease subunit [Kitasatospora sp. CB01950]OKJ10205.1 drug resistance transporter EmrB/QacA subfamily [Kitasatospora sp. CB01950]